jgi:hypothetical protein
MLLILTFAWCFTVLVIYFMIHAHCTFTNSEKFKYMQNYSRKHKNLAYFSTYGQIPAVIQIVRDNLQLTAPILFYLIAHFQITEYLNFFEGFQRLKLD